MFVLQKLYKRMSDVAPSERALRIIAGGPRKIRAQIEVTIMGGPAGFVKNACIIETLGRRKLGTTRSIHPQVGI